MRIWIPVIAGLLLGLGGIALALANSSADRLAETPAATQAVSMTSSLRFVPDPITIAVGDTVTWTNVTTNIPHTSTSDTGDAVSWDSGTVNAGGTFSLTFTTPGTFPYHCTFHQSLGMVGTITVQAAATATPTDTPTSTATATATPTRRATRTPTATVTPTRRATRTPTTVSTNTATQTPTRRPTRTPTSTVTPHVDPAVSAWDSSVDDAATDGEG
jgi:plastocyanin